MSKIDMNWFKTETGSEIIQAIKNNEKLKNFGLLEKPALSPPYSQYEEIEFKIVILGKSFSGKTSFIENLLSYSSNLKYKINNFDDYVETPGIQISNLYWPVKMLNSDKFLMFNLSIWDVGKLVSIKYDYIQPACFNNLDCIIFVFSWTDKQSFQEVFETIKNYYSDQNEQTKACKIIIGTKFDKIIHSEIDQDMISKLESLANTKIMNYSIVNNGSFEHISSIMNKLSELLYDQKLTNLNKK